MARSRSLAVLSALFLAMIFMVTVSSLPLASASTSENKSSDDDLICHTTDPKDCYPRVFQATDEFQTVHDDQEIPLGLHVRLNVWTGAKEAKINVPDEQNPALEGLPVDSAVVIVDPEQPDTPVIPSGAPAYEPVGKIKEPENGASSFYDALKLLKNDGDKSQGIDAALENLEDMSHDLYYGLKIAEDPEAVKALFCLMGEQSASTTEEGPRPRDHQAAMIISGALQNNPSALKEVAKIWPEVMGTQCPGETSPLSKTFYSSFVPSDTTDPVKSKPAASMAKAKVSAINVLIKDDVIREHFMKHDGMKRLLEVLIPEQQEWNGAQRKVGNLMLDNFLDTDMGATPGQWPTAAKLEDDKCQSKASETEEGCWDYHVERIMKHNEGGDENHWSTHVHAKLGELRGQDPPTHEHADL